jgi:hypothetical protein
MYSIEAQPAAQCLLTGEPLIRQTSPLRRLGAIFASVLGWVSPQDHVVPGYEGYGWCDSSERQILDDTAR